MGENAKVKGIHLELVANAEKALQTYGQLIKALEGVNKGLEQTSKILNQVQKETKKTGDETEKTTQQGEAMKKAFAFGGIIASARMLYRHFYRARDEMAAYIEDYNLYLISLKSHQAEALRFQHELNEAWGTNMSQTMRYQGFFMNLTTSLGIGKDFAYDMSRTLTQLTYDMSSFFNWTSDAAYQRLQAGIVGQTKPLRYAGIDVTQQTLQPLLEELGIHKYVTHLTQAEKVMLRYISILRQTTNSQGDYTRTMESTASQLKILNYQLSETYRWLGATFIGLVQKAIPYMNAFLMVLKEIFKWIATIFGVSADDFDFYTGKVSTQFDDFGEDVEGAIAKVNALKGSLRGFDEIHNITMPKAGGVEGSGMGTSIALQNELGRLMKEYEARMESVRYSAYAIRDRWLEILGFSIHTNEETGEMFIKWERLTPAMAGIGLLVGGLGLKLLGLAAKPLAWLLGLGGGKAAAAVGTVKATAGGIIGALSKLTMPLFKLGELILGTSLATSGFITSLVGLGAVVGVGAAIYGAYKGIQWLKQDLIGVSDVMDGVSKVTKDRLIPVFEDLDDVMFELQRSDLSQGILTDEQISLIEGRTNRVANTLYEKLDADKSQVLKNLDPLRHALGEEKYNSILKSMTGFYDDYSKTIETREKKIQEILKKLADDEVENKEELRKELRDLQEEMRKDAVTILSEQSSETDLILGRLKDRSVELSRRQAVELVAEAVRTKNETVQAADDQYHQILGYAQRMYDAKAITKEEYDDMVNSAKLARDESVKAAEEQFKGILASAKENMPELNKYVDLETGKIRTHWDKFAENLGNIFSNMMAPVNKALDTLETRTRLLNIELANANAQGKEMLNVTHTTRSGGYVSAYASGGMPDRGEVFVANERGAEMIGTIGGSTAVVNQDQIVTAVSQGVAVAVSGVMGGRASASQGSTVILKVNDLELGRAVIDSVNKTQNVLGLTIA